MIASIVVYWGAAFLWHKKQFNVWITVGSTGFWKKLFCKSGLLGLTGLKSY